MCKQQSEPSGRKTGTLRALLGLKHKSQSRLHCLRLTEAPALGAIANLVSDSKLCIDAGSLGGKSSLRLSRCCNLVSWSMGISLRGRLLLWKSSSSSVSLVSLVRLPTSTDVRPGPKVRTVQKLGSKSKIRSLSRNGGPAEQKQLMSLCLQVKAAKCLCSLHPHLLPRGPSLCQPPLLSFVPGGCVSGRLHPSH